MGDSLRREDVRAFLDRPWDELEVSRREHQAERHRAGGPEASLRAARRLRERFRRLHPEGPSAEARARDLADHVELKRRIDSVRDALRGR
jgi:hypothetical protein